MKDAKQAILIANLNLTAGLKAMEMFDFSAVYSFLTRKVKKMRVLGGVNSTASQDYWSDFLPGE